MTQIHGQRWCKENADLAELTAENLGSAVQLDGLRSLGGCDIPTYPVALRL